MNHAMNSSSIRRYRALALGAALLLSWVGAAAGAGKQHFPETTKKDSYLFVQSATSGTFDGEKINVTPIPPTTLFFTDRPERIAGHMLTPLFISLWAKGKDSFKGDPPNATISILNENKTINVVVELTNVSADSENLIYEVTVLDGEIPPEFGAVSIFIDESTTQGVALLDAVDTSSTAVGIANILGGN